MADDQSQKPIQGNQPSPQANIDTLVKELSRTPSSNPLPNTPRPQVPPTMNPPISSKPAPAPVPVPQMPPKPAPMPVPAPSVQAKPTPAPLNQAPKEYQSSIRTMNDDLSKLKAGQQPIGTNIPRKIEPPISPSPMPPQVKPAMPSQMKPSMPPAPKPITPPTAKPQVTMPPMPSAPAPKPADSGDLKSQFYIPENTPSPSSSSRSMMYMLIVGAVVIFGALYWFFVIRQPGVDTEPLPTFTPRPTATPMVNPLESLFPEQLGSIVLPGTGDPVAPVSGALAALTVAPGALGRITMSDNGVPPRSLNTLDVLDRFLVTYPSQLKTGLGANSAFIVYGQKESFDNKGKPILTNPNPGKRLVIITEVATSSLAVQQTLKNWESGMISGLGQLLGFDKTKASGAFLEGTYQGIMVRYKNFPYPDHSIDYALISYQGKTYWLVASSRESIFAAIDAFRVPPGK